MQAIGPRFAVLGQSCATGGTKKLVVGPKDGTTPLLVGSDRCAYACSQRHESNLVPCRARIGSVSSTGLGPTGGTKAARVICRRQVSSHNSISAMRWHLHHSVRGSWLAGLALAQRPPGKMSM